MTISIRIGAALMLAAPISSVAFAQTWHKPPQGPPPQGQATPRLTSTAVRPALGSAAPETRGIIIVGGKNVRKARRDQAVALNPQPLPPDPQPDPAPRPQP